MEANLVEVAKNLGWDRVSEGTAEEKNVVQKKVIKEIRGE